MDLTGGYTGDFEEDNGPVGLTLEEFEAHREACTSIVDQADAAVDLFDNPQFKTLIVDGFMQAEPHALADKIASGKFNENSQKNMFLQLQGIGFLREFLSDIIAKGNLARDELVALEEAREQSILEENGEA